MAIDIRWQNKNQVANIIKLFSSAYKCSEPIVILAVRNRLDVDRDRSKVVMCHLCIVNHLSLLCFCISTEKQRCKLS